jgi:hypothetical protein
MGGPRRDLDYVRKNVYSSFSFSEYFQEQFA